MKIGILQTGRSPEDLLGEHGDYPALFMDALAPYGFEFEVFEVDRLQLPDTPQVCDGWLITGSRHGVYEDHAFIAPLEAFVRRCFDAERPMIGVCFGHQVIAQALGGRVEQFRDGWAIGRQEYQWGGRVVSMNAWHQDQVIVAPKGARVCAQNYFCENAVLLYENKALTLQAHPEFSHSFVESLIEHRGRGKISTDLLDQAKGKMSQDVDSPQVIQTMAQFFKTRTLT